MSFIERFDQTKKTEFKDAAKLAVDNYMAKLRPFVTEHPCSGTQSAPVLYYDKAEAAERSGRVPTNRDNPIAKRRRWLKYRPPFDSGEYVDDEDVFKGMSDFQSPTMQAHTMAVVRKIDNDRILGGLFGDAYEGELGGAVKPHPTSQLIGVDTQAGAGTGAVGLNLAKLKASRLKFASNYHDLDHEDIVIAVTAQQIDDLSDEIELKSKDYQEEAGPQFSKSGKLTKVWNHVFVEFQGLTTKVANGNLIQRVPAWIPSTVALGIWKDVSFDTAQDGSRRNALYMWAEAVMDCRRLDDTGTVEIECFLKAA